LQNNTKYTLQKHLPGWNYSNFTSDLDSWILQLSLCEDYEDDDVEQENKQFQRLLQLRGGTRCEQAMAINASWASKMPPPSALTTENSTAMSTNGYAPVWLSLSHNSPT